MIFFATQAGPEPRHRTTDIGKKGQDSAARPRSLPVSRRTKMLNSLSTTLTRDVSPTMNLSTLAC